MLVASGDAGETACFFAGGGIIDPSASFISVSVGVVGCDDRPPLSFNCVDFACGGGEGGGFGMLVPSNASAKSNVDFGRSNVLKSLGAIAMVHLSGVCVSI